MVFQSKETKLQNLSPSRTPPPFVAATGFGDGIFDENLTLPLRAIVGCHNEVSYRYAAVTMRLRRDLTWTVCSPIFEQIEELAIPLSDMNRYLDVVHRFQSLKVVQFTMDEPGGFFLPPTVYERQSMPLTQKDVDDLETSKKNMTDSSG